MAAWDGGDAEVDIAAMLTEPLPAVPYVQRVLHTLAVLAVFVALAAASGFVTERHSAPEQVTAPAPVDIQRTELR